jgi:hypothetical protein
MLSAESTSQIGTVRSSAINLLASATQEGEPHSKSKVEAVCTSGLGLRSDVTVDHVSRVDEATVAQQRSAHVVEQIGVVGDEDRVPGHKRRLPS